MSEPFSPTSRGRIRRAPSRASYEREPVFAILDASLVCTVSFVDAGAPIAIPMAFARIGDALYLHAASSGRLAATLRGGTAVCLSVTLVDGLVFARSAFHHSLNYRSVVAHGRAEVVTDGHERGRALDAFVERMARGRAEDVRAPDARELKATAVIRIEIDEAAAKVRSGPPIDDERDVSRPSWAGVVPVVQRRGEAETAPDCNEPLPAYLR